jgi:hypothetical protein
VIGGIDFMQFALLRANNNANLRLEDLENDDTHVLDKFPLDSKAYLYVTPGESSHSSYFITTRSSSCETRTRSRARSFSPLYPS